MFFPKPQQESLSTTIQQANNLCERLFLSYGPIPKSPETEQLITALKALQDECRGQLNPSQDTGPSIT
tara:strand:+ start:246 stop:449 length:204 start_codon:yes stop_codon:yes gene_type:complete